ncbi:tissue inhibitor of metalloproteinase [Neodiprion pinetum]|uniref:Tissue inhibitor of metalloproteases n=1 Tax=Neodiprion lecontei TaxID=441921 RepID=A0A6J0BA13_NEOLC|nr:tissue inhibitor of metalloproteinase [Neodiprion lecontei]XP_015511794.1 tissue inhibitor of metalloproteinase [Neodiprion lecontei]XP_046423769.1 tissue inhibitor of metalloproteinase [Neodiprion fabricii]XP_046423770.1 tissue inhibitor of metalloproteinase [Neodiprion fabricii]XP_046423771.1 tissue inhibitor of metalloproteinase [Neodiprion fabricii]XP_046480042.1 tissue inhibitor of metalloproteinase [Neodiprion pinetum]XP_046480043.1 tissue inhibitor of metalloproteinase [Neodiprion p
MGRTISWGLLALLAIALSPSMKVEACSCQYSHPQTHFCQAEFVILARVMKHIPGDSYETAYRVKIHKKFKLSHEAERSLKDGLLYTASSDGMCGVSLQRGLTYVISGHVSDGKPRFNLCGLVMPWPKVSPRQRKGFRMLYHHNCVCSIQYTAWHNKGAALANGARKQCLWESTPGPQDCQEQHGLCMKGPAGCSWFPSVAYKNCIKEHQRKREEQWAREP